MKPALTLVRDALPIERISCAHIRGWLAAEPVLGDWSQAAPGAIRPQRLATLIRDRIWEAHDITIGSVRKRLAAADAAPAGLDFRVSLDVEIGPDQDVAVLSRTHFTLGPSGRIRAEIQLKSALGEHPITDGPVPLRRPS